MLQWDVVFAGITVITSVKKQTGLTAQVQHEHRVINWIYFLLGIGYISVFPVFATGQI